MTLWNSVLAWFYREFPCGCRVARHWDQVRACPEHLAKIESGERVVLDSHKANPSGVKVKIRNVR